MTLIPHRTPFFLPLLYPSLLWKVPTSRKEIYLTFDDGPVPGPTEFVLDHLTPEIKATFFCIGDNIKKHPLIFDRVIAEGHTIGNHTFNHLKGWNTPDEKYLENVKLFDDTVMAKGLKKPKLLRPPYGRIKRSQINALSSYSIVMWDVLSYDYDKNISAERCLRNAIRATRPGSIIVFHDSLKAEKNMTFALPRFIDHFAGAGFQFKSLHV